MEATRYIAIARRWWWLLIIGALMSVAAYGIASRIQDRRGTAPVFSAVATVFVSSDQGESSVSTLGSSTDTDRMLQSYAELIKGPAVARMIDSLRPGLSLAEVQRHIAVTLPPNTQLVQLAATGASADEAERLATDVLQSFVALHDEARLPGSTSISGVAPAQQLVQQNRADLGVVVVVAVFGLFSAMAIVVAFELVTDTVRDSADAEAATGLSVLAAIPLWSAGRNGRIASAIIGRRAGVAAERFRMLRTAIRLTSPDMPTQALLLSAPDAGAGTTTTVANYAFTLAQTGRRVVVVDANLREPAQHRMFDVAATPGLADALASAQVPLDDVLVATSIDGIALIPAGLCPANPSELLDSPRLDAVLAELRRRFDVIVIDSPPALAATDATLLAARADAMILIVRSDQTTRLKAAAAVELLGRATPRIVGVVLNRETSASRRRPVGSGVATASSAEAGAQ